MTTPTEKANSWFTLEIGFADDTGSDRDTVEHVLGKLRGITAQVQTHGGAWMDVQVVGFVPAEQEPWCYLRMVRVDEDGEPAGPNFNVNVRSIKRLVVY